MGRAEPEPTVLLVDRHGEVAKRWPPDVHARIIGHADLVRASRALSADSFTAVVVGAGAGEREDVVSFIREVRSAQVDAAVCVVMHGRELRLAHDRLDSWVVPLSAPVRTGELRLFLKMAIADRTAGERLRRTVSEVGSAYRFSRRELELLLLAATGVLRANLAVEMNVEEPTVKTLIHRMLAKCPGSAANLHELVCLVHRGCFCGTQGEELSGSRLA